MIELRNITDEKYFTNSYGNYSAVHYMCYLSYVLCAKNEIKTCILCWNYKTFYRYRSPA